MYEEAKPCPRLRRSRSRTWGSLRVRVEYSSSENENDFLSRTPTAN